MSEKEHKRDKSRAHDIRSRQDDAARKWPRKKSKPAVIDDTNVSDFLAEALKNGLNLLKIAQEAAEKKQIRE